MVVLHRLPNASQETRAATVKDVANSGSTIVEGDEVVVFEQRRSGAGDQACRLGEARGGWDYDTRDGDLTGPDAVKVKRTERLEDVIFSESGLFQGTAQDFTFEEEVNPWADFDGWNTAKAVGWTLLDVATFGIFDGLEKRKVNAWKDSGLSDTSVPHWR